MAKQVDESWTRERIDHLMAALGTAGLLRGVGNTHYEMHPLLTSYLRSRSEAPEACQRAFADVMGRLDDALTPKDLHEQRFPFFLHGANFHHALALAESLAMEQDLAALTQSLAQHALLSRSFGDSIRLFGGMATHFAAREDFEREAAAYHQLGRVAQEQRDFATAREWSLKSLAISERQGFDCHAAITYHQLGTIAEEQWDLPRAREWHLKSLAINEKQGNLHGAAMSYHQLGAIAQKQWDFATAREWYLKSLAIKEKQGHLQGAALTYWSIGEHGPRAGGFCRGTGVVPKIPRYFRRAGRPARLREDLSSTGNESPKRGCAVTSPTSHRTFDTRSPTSLTPVPNRRPKAISHAPRSLSSPKIPNSPSLFRSCLD